MFLVLFGPKAQEFRFVLQILDKINRLNSIGGRSTEADDVSAAILCKGASAPAFVRSSVGNSERSCCNLRPYSDRVRQKYASQRIVLARPPERGPAGRPRKENCGPRARTLEWQPGVSCSSSAGNREHIMTQQASNVIDLKTYRARRGQQSPLSSATSSHLVQSKWVLAVPVLMPVLVAWLPIWSIEAVSPSVSDE